MRPRCPLRMPGWWCLGLGVVLWWTGGGDAARGQTACCGPVASVDDLLRLGPEQLDALYRASPLASWPVPAGRIRGTPLVRTGTPLARPLSRGGRLLWQGKVFRPDEAAAVNRFFGLRIIRGTLSPGTSWLDGRPALILDYAGTSHLYANVRDEIRQVAPGLYLGLMFDRSTCPPTRTRHFALEVRR